MIRLTLLAITLLGCGSNAGPARVPAEAAEKSPTVSPAPKAPIPEASVRPGVNEKFLDPDLDVNAWVERFEGESREVFASRTAIVSALELSAGSSVADIGAGTGFFAQLFSEAVGEQGHVYANEISPRFLDHLRKRKSAGGAWGNVSIVVGAERSVELEEASVDLVFVCDVYHHFEYPQAVLATVLRALKPGGRLIIVDFKRVEGESSKWLLGHVRAGQEVFSAEIQSAGFQFNGPLSVPGLRDNYMLRFSKPE